MGNKFFNPLRKQESDIYLVACGYEQCPPEFVCGPDIRKYFILHYVIKGKGYYVSGGNEYALCKGDAFAIYPDDLVFYRADENDPWLFCWIIFDGKSGMEYYKKAGIRHDNLVFHLENDNFFKSVMSCLEYTLQNKNYLSQLRLTTCVLECLTSIELSNFSENNNISHKKAYVSAAVSFMDYHYGDGINVADAAKYTGLERSWFYRIFKEETGISPEKYLMNLRIEKAKKLILMGLEFKEIASAIGLKDVYHFTNLFKKITGVTPSQFRKNGE